MAAQTMSVWARLVGGLLGGGGAWIAMMVAPWNPPLAIAAAIAGAMAVFGALFGPAIWEAVIGLA